MLLGRAVVGYHIGPCKQAFRLPLREGSADGDQYIIPQKKPQQRDQIQSGVNIARRIVPVIGMLVRAEYADARHIGVNLPD
ncbi:hypothetical protein D3C76_1695440 [compost metagenome]